MKTLNTLKMTASKIGLTVLLVTSLVACSSSNPLNKAPKKEAAQFLMQASTVAGKPLGLDARTASFAYGECRSDKRGKDQCEKLYQGMVTYAKTQPTFHDVSVSDLTDASMWKTLSEYYHAATFDQI